MSGKSLPPFKDLLKVFTNYADAVDYLFRVQTLDRQRWCDCGRCLMDFNPNQMGFRCGLKGCRKQQSVFKGTIFYNKTLGPHEILHIAHLWLAGATIKTISSHLGHDDETISAYLSDFRVLVKQSLTECDQRIGGPGVIVEIDETKLGRRKNNRGHHVEGVWVLGGVERTLERRVFLVPVPNRSAETLLQVLSEHLLPGTLVFSDMWRGYISLSSRLDVQHATVNHSLHFVDPITMVHTNTIEGTWSALKRFIPIRRRTANCVAGHLFEFIWRRLHTNALWISFLQALRV
jgi:hypothetical protein